jgi:hypothetical protein
MYLKDSDEAEVLLRLIDDCDRLVEAKTLAPDAAYVVVSEAAKHHSDHPAEKRRAEAEYKAKEAAIAPVPVPLTDEDIPF